jgi:hypothetical protein
LAKNWFLSVSSSVSRWLSSASSALASLSWRPRDHLPLLRLVGPLQPQVVGDVLHPVDDEPQRPVRTEHRHVGRAPEPLLEVAPGCADVVLLHGHHVGGPVPAHPLERRPQVLDALRAGVPGIVRENREDVLADDRFPLGHRRLRIGVADRHDREIGIQDEETPGGGFEDQPEIGRRHGHLAPL